MRKFIQAAILLAASAAFATDQPPIPRLAQYKSIALSAGALMCPTKYTQGDVTIGTYYDGAWAMEKLAEQVIADGGNPAQWYACVDTANDIYRDAYVLRSDIQGGVPGYNEFTTGMRLHFLRTSEIESRKGVAYMAGYRLIDLIGKGAAYCGVNGTSWNYSSVELNREVSYCLRSMLDAIALGVTITPSAKLDTVKNNILLQIDKQIIAGTYRSSTASGIPVACQGKLYVQPFMLALQTNSLIKYYDAIAQEPNVYNAIKFVADWLWSGQGGNGVRVNGNQNVFFYQNCIDDLSDNTWNLAMPDTPAATDLNLFFPSVYQWLYMTPGPACGNVAYRDHADILFSTAVATGMPYVTLDGKHYNQNFTYSREYVRLRSLPEPTCGAMPPGVPGQPTITVGVNP